MNYTQERLIYKKPTTVARIKNACIDVCLLAFRNHILALGGGAKLPSDSPLEDKSLPQNGRKNIYPHGSIYDDLEL